MIESPADSFHEKHEITRIKEAWRRREPEISAKGFIQHLEHIDFELSTIFPIVISFRIIAVRGIHYFHRIPVGSYRLFDYCRRLLRKFIAYGYCRCNQTAVAYLIPIICTIVKLRWNIFVQSTSERVAVQCFLHFNLCL